jgi:subtilase family serine protease
VAPYDFATIYNVLPLWTASPTAITGTGQTIAIAGTSDIALSDVAAFRSAFGLPAGLTPQEVKGANGVDPGICTSTTAATCNIEDLTENTLDVEWSGAVAPGAQIVLVTLPAAQSATDDTVYDSSKLRGRKRRRLVRSGRERSTS